MHIIQHQLFINPIFFGKPSLHPPKTLEAVFFFTQQALSPQRHGGPGVATCRSRLGIESHSPRLGWRLGGECHCRKPRGIVGGRGLSNLCGVDEELATRALDFMIHDFWIFIKMKSPLWFIRMGSEIYSSRIIVGLLGCWVVGLLGCKWRI